MSIDLERHRPERKVRSPRPEGSMSGWATAAVVIAMFLIAYVAVRWLAGAVSEVIATPEATTLPPGQAVTFVVLPGEPASQIARGLAQQGVVASAADFDRVVREARASDRLQAGSYQLETGMEPREVLDILLAGPGETVYRLTIVEGLSVERMLDSIAFQTGIELEELVTPLLDGTVTSTLLPEEPTSLQDWEGLLFPDTYEFRRDATGVDILARLARTAEERVNAIDWSYLIDRGMTPYDGIIIASMIEREVRIDEERPLVASVIYNRLDLDMLLQIDATVVYALGGTPEGGLTLDHLQIDSPYNTYRYPGLPPTPISGVRLASLAAAANPAETDYLYYVLINDEGEHFFTDDFDEFLEAQRQAGG